MKIVIDIPDILMKYIVNGKDLSEEQNDEMALAIANGTPLPKEHSFIAICDSDFPITEEVKQDLKNTVFVGNEDCRYCFDMTEIISR